MRFVSYVGSWSCISLNLILLFFIKVSVAGGSVAENSSNLTRESSLATVETNNSVNNTNR